MALQLTHIMPPSSSPPPPPSAGSPIPLTEQHYVLICSAAAVRRPIQKAARTALSSAVTILVIGVAALPLAMLSLSLWSYCIAGAICLIGWIELRGYRLMRRADPSAATYLGRNQLVFLGLILLYCGWQMASFSVTGAKSSLLSSEVQAQMAQLGDMQQDIERQLAFWATRVVYGLYGLVALLSLIFQGGLAIYYFTRKKHLDTFNANIPAWIKRLFVEIGA